MSWHEIQLGKGIRVKHGFAFKGEFFSSSGEYMVLTPGNFLEKGGFRVRDGKERFYHADFPEDYLLAENDLIVAMTEQGEGLLGSAARIPADGKYLHNQRLGLVEIIAPDLLDKQFMYWVLNSAVVRAQIRATATGAKVKHTAPERIKKVRVSVPDIGVQRAISHVLDSYDDLIATNQRRIALLEDSARLLYREWFVKLRFPGHELVKVVDGLPEGWEQWSIERFGRVETGKTPSTSNAEFFGGDIPFIKTPDMHSNMLVVATGQRLSEAGSDSQKNKLLPKDTIIVSCIGTVGVVALTSQPSHTNQQINAVIPHEKFFRAYLYFSISTLKEYMLGMGGGSTMANISKSKFSSIEIPKPPNRLLIEFEETVAGNISQIESLLRANLLLTEARDALLPKLMSGQLAV